jgi:hypothetical protein
VPTVPAAREPNTEATRKPPYADDPRPAYWRNVGGPWAT